MSQGSSVSTRSPRNVIDPASGAYTPVITLNNVDLPLPFGPMSPTSSPSLTLVVTPSTARIPPKRFRTSSSRRKSGSARPPDPWLRVEFEGLRREPPACEFREVLLAHRVQGGMPRDVVRRDRVSVRVHRLGAARPEVGLRHKRDHRLDGVPVVLARGEDPHHREHRGIVRVVRVRRLLRIRRWV